MRSFKGADNRWAAAALGGTLLTLAIFSLLPGLSSDSKALPAAITVAFEQLPAPQSKAAKRQPRHKAKTIPRPRPKPAPKPVQASKSHVRPSPQPEPTPERKATPVQTAPPAPADSEGHEEQEAPPTPTPIFKLTAMPRFAHRQLPEYPPAMKRQGREGTVKLAVLLDSQGRVRKVTVEKSAGPEFDRAAVAAVKSSRFTPGTADGKAVAVLMRFPVRFKLR